MPNNALIVEAVFEDGILRPLMPLSLPARQRVTLIVQVASEPGAWPEDVAAIYQEIAEEDRRMAQAMWDGVRKTWPSDEEPS